MIEFHPIETADPIEQDTPRQKKANPHKRALTLSLYIYIYPPPRYAVR